MSEEQIRQAVIAALASVAPEGDYEGLRPDRPLRDQLDIDSFDFLKVVIYLHDKLGIEIPETEYQELATLNRAVAYLGARKDVARTDR
jgi:acyl carrier protein